MATAVYTPLPQVRALLHDIDACDNAYWDNEHDLNARNPKRAKTPTGGPESPRVQLTVKHRDVAAFQTHMREHPSQRVVAWHPYAPADWVESLGDRKPSQDTCDLVHAALTNAHLDWDVLRALHSRHRHDPVRYPHPAVSPRSLTPVCDDVTLAESVLRNRAAPPDLVAHAIRVLLDSSTAHTGGRAAWWDGDAPHLLFSTVVQHANASAEDVTAFVATMVGSQYGYTIDGGRVPYEVLVYMDQIVDSGGYVFGEYGEYNAGGRVGCMDVFRSMRIVSAAVSPAPAVWA